MSNFKSNSHLPKICFYLIQWKPFKNDENAFYFMLKAPFVLDIFIFMSDLLVMLKAAVVNVKIYDIRDWTKNYYIRYITQYHKK